MLVSIDVLWGEPCCGENLPGIPIAKLVRYKSMARIFRERNLTFGSEKPILKDIPNRSSERYVFYVLNFAYEPPNVDTAIEDKIKDRQKAMLQATHVIHGCRMKSLFFLLTNWTTS